MTVPEPFPHPGVLEFCVLASGSKGNAIHVSDGVTAVLVDAGLSGVEIQRRMARRGLSPADLSAILVTHEHGDHVRGVGVLARRFGLPVYLNPDAAKALNGRLGKISDLRSFRPGEPFSLGGLAVHPFATSHDAADPVGFTLGAGDRRLGIATDLGVATNLVRHHLRNCSAVILETNHDPDLLMNGPHPWHLKQRVRGRSGHLSNGEARDLLLDILHPRLSHVILGHLSEENNRPELALAMIREALDGRRPAARIRVAGQDEGAERIRLDDSGRRGNPD